MINISTRNRKDYRKIDNIPIKPFYFSNKPIQPITVIESKIIDLPEVKKNYYIANTYGEVYNDKGVKLKPALINSGYLKYSLIGDKDNYPKKYYSITCHKLFMNVFNPIDNSDKLTIDHINGNRFDNRLNNLEYVTQAENNRRKYLYKPVDGCNNYKSLFNRSQIRIIVQELEKETKYSIIAKMIGIEPTKVNLDYIGNIKRGITYKREVEEIRKELGFNDYP